MSQHIFRQTVGHTRYEVQIGWDKPCQRFYFVISPFEQMGEPEDTLDDPVASNLYLSNPDAATLEDINAVCEDYGLTVPKSLFANVIHDCDTDTVNKVKMY